MKKLEWKTEQRKISDLVPHSENPREMTKDQNAQLEESLRKFNLAEIPAINTSNKILAGHQRLRILESMGRGQETIDVRVPSRKLTKDEEDEYLVRSNKNVGGWDYDVLANNFEVKNLMDWGFSEEELVGFGGEDKKIEEDETPELQEKAITELGSMYQLGRHRLMCGDSTSEKDVARLMDGEKADMTFTDPPYRYKAMGENGAFAKGHAKLKESIKDLVDFNPAPFLDLLPSLFTKGLNAYIFCNTDLVPDYCVWAKEKGFNFNILTWHKNSFIPASGNHHFPDTEYLIYISKGAIFNCGLDVNYGKYFITDSEKSKDHPTIKPQEIIQNEVRIGSNKGGIVCDLFGGSGSTLIACEQTDRKCRMMELDPRYCDVIVKRYADLVGADADKIFKTGVHNGS